MRRWTDSAAATAACLCLACAGWGQEAAESLELRLSNEQIACTVILEDGRLAGERLEALAGWAGRFGVGELTLACDADFAIDLMWTGWRAPGKISNADNLLQLTAKDFRYADHVLRTGDEHGSRLEITLKGIDTPFELQLAYRLEPDQFFLRRSLAIRHPEGGRHFLRWIRARAGRLEGELEIIKDGGFGRPVALRIGQGGFFAGLEYPASTNRLAAEGGGARIECGQEFGQRIGDEWISSRPVVTALVPGPHVKLWFWRYCQALRVAPLRPYLLYNSWYDVRSGEYTERPEDEMNEANVLRIVEAFRREMVQKRGLTLDAFVLDDGWDVYASDWVLRPHQFPNGLAPIRRALEGMDAKLGIWFGPIGGYSFRSRRVDWMREHGYETVGDQLCIAGIRYRELFERRVLGMVREQGVGYFKWDGIQFSCSEPGHGHPVGVYSRRAVMEAVIGLCEVVRQADPDIFLNVTSGTWLSPWWLSHSNQIWMQGYDYGYADVPSISRRDGAITYRDYVLHDDLVANDFWFPIANLMTHGIIKGRLQQLGGRDEPLDKFTDNALLYFARGVSMWELYISPDMLTDGEWDALAGSIRWARDRFDVLRHTEMIGGDPGARRAYGYVHFSGGRGIVAARNPFIEPQELAVELAPALGLDPDARSLVIERVYPTRWIAPRLYGAGEVFSLPLEGYRTAVYEIYPLDEAAGPLLAGCVFEFGEDGATSVLSVGEGARLLNPDRVEAARLDGRQVDPEQFRLPADEAGRLVREVSVSGSGSEIQISFALGAPAVGGTLAVLLEPYRTGEEADDPVVTVCLDGSRTEPEVEARPGRWGWYKVDVGPGEHSVSLGVEPPEGSQSWSGTATAWLVCSVQPAARRVELEPRGEADTLRPMPPRPWPAGRLRTNIKLGQAELWTAPARDQSVPISSWPVVR